MPRKDWPDSVWAGVSRPTFVDVNPRLGFIRVQQCLQPRLFHGARKYYQPRKQRDKGRADLENVHTDPEGNGDFGEKNKGFLSGEVVMMNRYTSAVDTADDLYTVW